MLGPVLGTLFIIISHYCYFRHNLWYTLIIITLKPGVGIRLIFIKLQPIKLTSSDCTHQAGQNQHTLFSFSVSTLYLLVPFLFVPPHPLAATYQMKKSGIAYIWHVEMKTTRPWCPLVLICTCLEWPWKWFFTHKRWNLDLLTFVNRWCVCNDSQRVCVANLRT
jgi:hypothetical protein